MRLADFILAHMEQILMEWQSYAQTLPAAKKMDQNALRDHAKQMLEWVAADLGSSQTEEKQISKSKGREDSMELRSQDDGTGAKQHGAHRFESGYSIGEMMSEHRALRVSVLRLWNACSESAQPSNLGDMTRFNEAIDEEMTLSVTSYFLEKEQQVRLLETILVSSPDHSCVLDLEGSFLYANKSLADQFNLSMPQMIGKNLFDLGVASAADLHEQIQQVIQTGHPLRREMAYQSSTGKRSYEYILTPVFKQDGQIEAVTGTARDITERKAWDEKIWHKANYDTLTGLPNRRLFRDRLEQEVRHSERTETPVALLFIDLDRFKEANDMLGHDAGDTLLRQAAERIRSCIREKDTVARLGGDEFTVILTDIDELDHVQTVADKILKELMNPFFILQERVNISGSIGITFFPQDARTPEHLVRNADQAMYMAKNAGRNQASFFTPKMQEAARARYRLIADLRTALSQNQMALYYQPIVDLSNGRIHKAEALLRWFHPELGLVLPDKFIGLAEETGLINDIGNWVFTEAALRSQAWGRLLAMPFQVSINKSPVQLMAHPHGMNWIIYLKQLGLARGSISVEITEGVLLNVSGAAADKLSSLQDAGIQLAIDDFGTGYSSMSYLNKFDVDYLKIDQSFVHNMATDPNCKTIAETIIVMAHKLGLKVIAEGVETAAQRDWLKTAGSDYAQGFLFSVPLPAEQFTQFLTAGQIRH